MKFKSPMSLDALFKVSYCGFTLDKHYFYGIYKTRVLKYKGKPLAEKDWGNIISPTPMFSADNKADATEKAKKLYGLYNPSFRPLKVKDIEAEHKLLDIKSIVPPSFDGDLRHIQRLSTGLTGRQISLQEDCNFPLPESFLGVKNAWIKRRMPHISSPDEDITYLYHPWHGAGDLGLDWYAYPYRSFQWRQLDNLFHEHHQRDVCAEFGQTEYTDLDKEEQRKVRNLRRLEYLDAFNHDFMDFNSIFWQRFLCGQFYIHEYGRGENGIPEWHGECNFLSAQYKTQREREIEIRAEMDELESKIRVMHFRIAYLSEKLKEVTDENSGV